MGRFVQKYTYLGSYSYPILEQDLLIDFDMGEKILDPD